MDIATVRELWKPRKGDPKAGVEWWNGKAEHFSEIEPPTAEKNIGIRLIQSENMVSEGDRTLDVGCGCGRFSFALEAMGAEASGTDFSPEMIKKAEEKGRSIGSKARFSVDDWHSLDLKEKGWKKSFDLVLANMTPAIASADTFLKLIEASRGWVLMVRPTRRTNSVMDELSRLTGTEQDTVQLDETLAYAFDLAWFTGGCPKLEYEKQVWEMDLRLEDAIKEYTARMSYTQKISDGEKRRIREYLKSIADGEGNVHETTHTTIAAMYWKVQ